MNFKVIGLLTIVLSILTGQAQNQNDAYDAPDQVVWHAPSKTWFVSNLGGGISLEKDNNGWISRIDQSGKILDTFWFGKEEGMHAPSGMTITEDFLFVVDRNGIYQIDIANQKIETFIEIPDGEFLNDIVRADNGDLYISDFFGNKIYKIPAHSKKAEVWLKTDRLEAPDGLYMEKDKEIAQRIDAEEQIAKLEVDKKEVEKKLKDTEHVKNQLEQDLVQGKENYSLLMGQYQQEQVRNDSLLAKYNGKMDLISSLKSKLSKEEKDNSRINFKLTK